MPTIGRATIDVHYDGKGLEREAKELGEETGATAGEEHAKAFDDEVSKGFKETQRDLVTDAEKAGREAGEKSGKGFGQDFDKSLQGVIKGDLDKLSRDVANIFAKTDGLEQYTKKVTGVGTEFGKVRTTVDDVSGALGQLQDAGLISEKALERNLDILGKFEGEAGKAAKATDSFSNEVDGLHAAAIRMNDAFDEKNLREVIDQEGKAAGASRDWKRSIDEINDSFKESEGHYDRTESAAHDYNGALDDLRGSMAKLNPELDEHRSILGRIEQALSGNGSTKAFRDLGNEAEIASKKVGHVADDSERMGKKIGSALPNVGNLVKGLGHFDPGDNLGQLILLVIALLPQLATLASAAGGGLLILGAGLTAAGLGALGLAVGFSDIFGKVKDLPKNVQPAAKAIQGLKDDFGKLRDNLQEHLFEGLSSDISKLEKTAIPALNAAMGTLGGALNKVLSSWLKDLNSSGFATDIQNLFKDLAPSIENIGKIASNVFGIIGQLIQDASGDANEFTGQVADATGKFLAFLKTPEGKTAVHDFLEDAKTVLKKVGDVLVDVGKALGDLVTPKNIDHTISVLDNLGDAAVNLSKSSGKINEIIVFLGGLIAVIGQIADGIGTAFDNFLGGVDDFVILLGGLIDGATKVVQIFTEQVGKNFAAAGKAISQAAHGDFVGAGKTISDAMDDSKKAVGRLGDAFVELGGGDGAALSAFRNLPKAAQVSLTDLSGRLGVSGEDAKKLGGTFQELATGAGISIGQIAKAKSWDDVQRITGAADSTIEGLKKQFGSTADGASKSLSSLASNANGSLGKLNSDLKGTGDKSQSSFQKVISEAAAETGRDLSKLSANSSLKDIAKAFGVTGNASKTDMADRIITSANASGTAIGKLPPKIQDLINNYGDIPSTVKTKVTIEGAESAISQAGRVKGALDALHDKRINITQIVSQIGDPGKIGGSSTAVGGVMAGGKLLAGGKPGWGPYAFANGGVINKATAFGSVLAGEAGAEAIVPLTGSLNQVDRSVRGLAAYARGKVPIASTSSTTNSGATIAAGAIVVNEAGNGRTTATAVLDRITARL